MKGHRKVAVVEDFFTIIKQVHDVDCLHAGSKNGYVTNLISMTYCTFLILCVYIYLLNSTDSEFVYTLIFQSVVDQYIKLCKPCNL